MHINFFCSTKNNALSKTIFCKLSLISALLLYALTQRAMAYEAYCNDPNSPDNYKGTWVARYNVVSSGYGPLNYVTFLGFRPNGQSAVQEIVSDQWDIELDPWPLNASLAHTKGWNTVIYGVAVGIYDDGRVESPNGRCQIYLSPYTYTDTTITQTDPKVVLIGDSVTRSFSNSRDSRTILAKDFSSFGWLLQTEAWPGRTWQDSFDSSGNVVPRNTYDPSGNPLLVNNYRDEIRGMISTNPKAIVFELGTNDAVQNALHKLNPSYIPSYGTLRSSTISNMLGAYNDAKATGRCLIFLTPTDYPTQIFGLGQAYADESVWVANMMRFFLGSSVKIVDWASISRSHHLPDGSADDWFPDGDEIHPNYIGILELINTIGNAVSQCK